MNCFSSAFATTYLFPRCLGLSYNGPITSCMVYASMQIYPHGSTDKNPFVTMGSGSLAAMSVFETGYREDMDEVCSNSSGSSGL